MIENTIKSLKESKHITSLFKKVLVRFDKDGEKNADNLTVLAWLKALLQVHWANIVKHSSKEDMKSLGMI